MLIEKYKIIQKDSKALFRQDFKRYLGGIYTHKSFFLYVLLGLNSSIAFTFWLRYTQHLNILYVL